MNPGDKIKRGIVFIECVSIPRPNDEAMSSEDHYVVTCSICKLRQEYSFQGTADWIAYEHNRYFHKRGKCK